MTAAAPSGAVTFLLVASGGRGPDDGEGPSTTAATPLNRWLSSTAWPKLRQTACPSCSMGDARRLSALARLLLDALEAGTHPAQPSTKDPENRRPQRR
jgi:hypothetical protein